MTGDEKLEVVCIAYQALFDNWQDDATFGRLIKKLLERIPELREAKGVWESVQCSGALTLHNWLPDAPGTEER